MNALLKMIYSQEQAKAALKLCKKKGLMIVDKKHGIAMDDQIIESSGVSLNLGGYGSSFSVNIGEKFSNSWGLTAYEKRNAHIYSDTGSITQWDSFTADYSEERGKTFTNLAIFFSDKKSSITKDLKWSKDIQEVSDQINKIGGTVVKTLDKANIVVTLDSFVDLKTNNDVIVIDQDNFFKALPKPSSERAEPVKRFKGGSASLWKLLSTRDIASVKQGLDLAASLPEEIDSLLDGCTVDKNGELVRGKRFTGTGPALAYLDVALYGLLSAAAQNSSAEKIRKAIKKIDINVVAPPKLVGFESLQMLSIKMADVKDLKITDLKSFGLMPKLKSLELSSEGYSVEPINSLSGLNAPNLERIIANQIGLKDISALQGYKHITEIDFSSNDKLKSIDSLSDSAVSLKSLILWGCEKLESIDALKGAVNLRSIDLSSCSSIKSLKPLSSCKEFDFLNISDTGITSLDGLENIIIKNITLTYRFSIKNSIALKSLISVAPQIPSDVKLSIGEVRIEKE